MARRLMALLLAVMLLVGATSCRTVELGTTNLDTLVLSETLQAEQVTSTDDITATDLVTAADLTATDDVTAGDDLVVTGLATIGETLGVTGAATFSGPVTFAGGGDGLLHASQAFTYTAAAGGTVTLFTIPDGAEWYVDSLVLNVTTNWDATGDDVTLVIGDGNDADGFCVLADGELQTTDTEGTGWAAGWQCQVAATRGVYQDGTGGFIYAPSGAAETIDAVIDETSGETIAAGAATAHIWYRLLP